MYDPRRLAEPVRELNQAMEEQQLAQPAGNPAEQKAD